MNKYPGLYNYPHNPYGNAVVLSGLLDQKWVKDNLRATQENWNEDCNGQSYRNGRIAGYSLSSTSEGHRFYSFHDAENKQRVLERLPNMVVDPNPVLADEPAPDPKKYSNVASGGVHWVWYLVGLVLWTLLVLAIVG